MKTQEELLKLDAKKLSEELAQLQHDLIRLDFSVKNGQAKDTHMLKETRKQIARVQTIINSPKA